MLDETQLENLTRAVTVMRRSMDRVATGDRDALLMVTEQYRRMHARIAEVMPEDVYIAEALALPDDPEASDEVLFNRLNFAIGQLSSYLRDLMRAPREIKEGE